MPDESNHTSRFPFSASAAPLPASVSPREHRQAPELSSVLSVEDLGADYRRLRLHAPRCAAGAAPGQFVHVRVPALDASAMRRPISICDADPATGVLTLVFKIVGRGTAALARVRKEETVDLMGPLGNGFPPPPDGAEVLLVGGGYGVAPLYFLARSVLRAGAGEDPEARRGEGLSGSPGAPARVHLFVGGRSKGDLLLLDDFRALGVGVHPATDDGSLGTKGLVTAPLDAFLAARPRGRTALFACGPAPMLRAIDERALALGADAWLSLDRRMLCGVGACLGCTQVVRDGAATATVRVCADGPVFRQGRIVWDGSAGC